MCTVLAGVKPSHVARLRQANVMRCKGPRVCADRWLELAVGLRVIGPRGAKPDRLGGQRCAGTTGVAGVNGRASCTRSRARHREF